MKCLLLVVSFSLVLLSVSFARDDYVKPHVTQDGQHVAGHHRTSPTNRKLDNYSTQGNYNRYTGEIGKRAPYAINPYSSHRHY